MKQVLGRAEEDEKTAEEKITAEEKKIGERKSREGAEGVRQLLVIRPCEPGREENRRLTGVLETALEGIAYREVTQVSELEETQILRSGPGLVLFALDLGRDGINLEYIRLLGWLRLHPAGLDGWVGGVVADADSDLYTKSAARELVFTANCSGCAFVGRPLVEGTRTLSNFSIVASNMGTNLDDAYVKSVRILAEQLMDSAENKRGRSRKEEGEPGRPRLLVLHASSHKNSNTYAVWNGVKSQLPGISVRELGLRNGTLSDCSGCPYKMCLHFGEQGSCFYGGVMVEDVYPAIREADAILLLAPNYNDALSANLTAFINRLTALFRTTRFYDKQLFGIVVSGYSGSDLIAEQMIAALNMNKTFYLPGHFAMMETANQAGEAMALPGIEERMKKFAQVIRDSLLSEKSRWQS